MAEAAVVNIVDLDGELELNGDAADEVRLLEDNGRLCFDERGKSNRPPLFLLLFRGGIVVQQAILCDEIYYICL